MASTQTNPEKFQPPVRLHKPADQIQKPKWWESNTERIHLYWIGSFLIFNFVYIPAILLGLFYQDILLVDSPIWSIAKSLYFVVLPYYGWSLYQITFHWENGMDKAFYRTVAFILFGMLIWFLISLQGAY